MNSNSQKKAEKKGVNRADSSSGKQTSRSTQPVSRRERRASRSSVEKKKVRTTQAAPDEPSGTNIYKDAKGRIIYYYPLTKQAWYVPKYDFRKFNRLRSRFLISVAAFMVLLTILQEWFQIPFWIPLVISIALAVVLEMSFAKLLKTMQPVKKFNKDELQPTISLELNPEARTKLILKIVLLIVLGVLIVFNAYEQHYETMVIFFCYLAMALCFFEAGKDIWLLIKSQQAKKAA